MSVFDPSTQPIYGPDPAINIVNLENWWIANYGPAENVTIEPSSANYYYYSNQNGLITEQNPLEAFVGTPISFGTPTQSWPFTPGRLINYIAEGQFCTNATNNAHGYGGGLPDGLVLSGNNGTGPQHYYSYQGVISGTPATGSQGLYAILLTVTSDNVNYYDCVVWINIVANLPTPNVFYYTQDSKSVTPSPPVPDQLTASVGVASTFAPIQQWPNGDQIVGPEKATIVRTYTVSTGSLPPGMSISSNATGAYGGILTGTPTAAGTYSFTISGTSPAGAVNSLGLWDNALPADSTGGGDVSVQVTIVVTEKTPTGSYFYYDQDSTVTTNTAAENQLTATVGTSGSFTPLQAWPNGGVIDSTTESSLVRTYAETGSLPPGMVVDSSTGIFHGIPTTAGTFTFTVTETANGGFSVVTGKWDASQAGSTTITATVTIVVVGIVAPKSNEFFYTQDGGKDTTPQDHLTATVGTAASFTPLQAWPNGDDLNANSTAIVRSYTVSGALPPGMTLSQARGSSDAYGAIIRGTPTAAATYNFTVTGTTTGQFGSDGTWDMNLGGTFSISALVTITVADIPPPPPPPNGNLASPSKTTRIGDTCSHGATVMTGDDSRWVNDQKVARIGDMVNCPRHGVNPIISQAAMTVNNGNQRVSVVSSMAKCGAMVMTGSDNVYTEDK